jgi:hypothetical protein
MEPAELMDFRKKRVCPTVLLNFSLPHEYDCELSRSVVESAKSQSQDHETARFSFHDAEGPKSFRP